MNQALSFILAIPVWLKSSRDPQKLDNEIVTQPG
jgi:hypothetical protein